MTPDDTITLAVGSEDQDLTQWLNELGPAVQAEVRAHEVRMDLDMQSEGIEVFKWEDKPIGLKIG